MTAHSHVRLQFRYLGNRSALTLKPHLKQTYLQWRRQELMVGEAHLVGEANVFNVKYIIHECGLLFVDRRQVATF